MKRKFGAADSSLPVKRLKTAVRPTGDETHDTTTKNNPARNPKICKLVAPRPFPTVPASVSATGPRSAHKEGQNFICVTRKVKLGAYLGRCKKLLVEKGYDALHLHAMGAAIPHLLTLAVSLPSILPFAKHEIQIEIRTGSVEVIDEVIPDDEDEDIDVRRRVKSSVSVVIHVPSSSKAAQTTGKESQTIDVNLTGKRNIIVVQEQEQDDDIGERVT